MMQDLDLAGLRRTVGLSAEALVWVQTFDDSEALSPLRQPRRNRQSLLTLTRLLPGGQGVFVYGAPGECGAPHCVYAHQGRLERVSFLMLRLQVPGTPGYGELRWDHTYGLTRALHAPHDVELELNAFAPIWHAFNQMANGKILVGRPRGSSYFATPAECRHEVLEVMRHVRQRGPITQSAIVAAFSLQMSVRQLQRELKANGLNYATLKREACLSNTP